MFIPTGTQKAIPTGNTIYIPYDVCRMLDKREKCHLYWNEKIAFSIDPRKLRMIYADWFAPYYDMLRAPGSREALFVRDSTSLGYGHFKMYDKETNKPITLDVARGILYRGQTL